MLPIFFPSASFIHFFIKAYRAGERVSLSQMYLRKMRTTETNEEKSDRMSEAPDHVLLKPFVMRLTCSR